MMATIKTITAVSLTSELQPGEEPDEVIFALQRDARFAVENEIDALLMQSGKAPYFRQLEDNAVKKPISDEVPF